MNRVLRVGDSSVRVAEARATLARLGLLSDFTGELSAWKKQKYSETDKTFDADLAEVLKAFQQSRGIL
ncbi:peptidoglycan-binding protein, partial [Helicobacter pylori]